MEYPPDLTADSIAQRLGGTYPAIPKGYVSFKGYLAPMQNGLFRFFVNDSFESWFEVEKDDIAARINIPANETDPRSIVYIKREARVVACQVHKAHDLHDIGADPSGGGLTGHPPWP